MSKDYSPGLISYEQTIVFVTVNILDLSSGLFMFKDRYTGLFSFEQTIISKVVNVQDLSSVLLMSNKLSLGLVPNKKKTLILCL